MRQISILTHVLFRPCVCAGEVCFVRQNQSWVERGCVVKGKSCSDKNGQCRGSVSGGVIDVWPKNIPKCEFSSQLTIGEIDSGLEVYGNSYWVIRELSKKAVMDATENWIENTEAPVLRERRRRIHESGPVYGKDSYLQEQQIDSAARVVRTLYELETGRPCLSWFERSVMIRENRTRS